MQTIYTQETAKAYSSSGESNMSWMDIVAVIIIVIMSILGYRKGFTVTVMHIFSWVISGLIAVKFYPVVSTYLIQYVRINFCLLD